MSDRELLEMAAKAFDDPKLFANTTGAPWQYWIGFCEVMQCDVTRLWNPLEDDGDALRLAVKLGLLLDCQGPCAMPMDRSGGNPGDWVIPDGVESEDQNLLMRTCIVRAAAEIGRAMP
jgi:hypothetical protein